MSNLEQKKQEVGELKEKFQKANGCYFLNFSSMDVASTAKLRKLFHEKGIEYRVAKNTLIWLALNEAGMQGLDRNFLNGNTGIAFGYDDPTVPAKVLKPILDKEDKPKFKAAIVEGVFYGSDQFKTLASLPSKTDMIAGILGSLNSPISGIVGSLNAVMRDLASVIEEVAKKNN
ncbi:MAG: 50S ribosomal protein L10 [Candidatus Kapaibacteriota bacterium]